MSTSFIEQFFSSSSPTKLSVLVGIYCSSLVLIAALGFYMLFYGLALLSFLLLVPLLQDTQLFRKLTKLSLPLLLLVLFLTAFVLRGMMLYQNEVITNDMSLMVARSEHAIDGDVPYKEFPVNKPPLYLYLAYVIGISFGTGLREFRLFFTIFDALVPIAMFFLLRQKYSKGFASYAALLYAICPLNIIMIGFSGHYEPMLLLSVLLAFHFFFKERYYFATFLLGIGFALKIYPLVLLPFFIVLMPGWRKRIGSIVSFFVPFLLSLIPLMFMVDNGIGYYIDYQTGEWVSIAIKSYALSFILLLDSDTLLGVRITELVMYFFLLVIVLFFMSWLGKSSGEASATSSTGKEGDSRMSSSPTPKTPDSSTPQSPREQLEFFICDKPLLLGLRTGFWPVDVVFSLAAFLSEKINRFVLKLKSTDLNSILLLWYKVMVATFAIYYGLVTATTFKLFKEQWGIPHANPVMFLAIVIYFPVVLFFLRKYYHDIFPAKDRLRLDSHQELYYLSIFSIMLLLFSSPDYCPWYIMWFLPFVFSLQNSRVKYFLLWIIFWNFPGKDFNIMPGLSI